MAEFESAFRIEPDLAPGRDYLTVWKTGKSRIVVETILR